MAHILHVRNSVLVSIMTQWIDLGGIWFNVVGHLLFTFKNLLDYYSVQMFYFAYLFPRMIILIHSSVTRIMFFIDAIKMFEKSICLYRIHRNLLYIT